MKSKCQNYLHISSKESLIERGVLSDFVKHRTAGKGDGLAERVEGALQSSISEQRNVEYVVEVEQNLIPKPQVHTKTTNSIIKLSVYL